MERFVAGDEAKLLIPHNINLMGLKAGTSLAHFMTANFGKPHPGAFQVEVGGELGGI